MKKILWSYEKDRKKYGLLTAKFNKVVLEIVESLHKLGFNKVRLSI